MRLFLLILPAFCLLPAPAHAQLLADTTLSWQGYQSDAQCRVLIYRGLPDAERRHTVVLQELARNDGPSTLHDARFLAELVSRRFSLAPAEAFWVYHWGAFSFEGAAPDRDKELFLRATFRPNRSGSLGAPTWRVVSREDVEDLTDRHFR